MINKYKSVVIVILLFISLIQILLLIFNITPDLKLDKSSKLLMYRLNEFRDQNNPEIYNQEKKLSLNDENLEQGVAIESLFNENYYRIHTNIELSITTKIFNHSIFNNNSNYTFSNKILRKSSWDIQKLKFRNFQPLFSNNTLKNINIQNSNPINIKSHILISNSIKNMTKKSQINVEKTNSTIDLKLLPFKLKDINITSVNKHKKNKFKKKKIKDKFNYNENDKNIQIFFDKITINFSTPTIKYAKLYDIDEEKFAKDSLRNNILNEYEELPLLDEAITKQLNFQRQFSNDSVKVISMSLYGDEKRYTIGALRNAELIKIYFPGWKLRIYMETQDSIAHHGQVPQSIKEQLVSLDVDIVYVDAEVRHLQPMLWRFLVADDPAVDVFLIRDCDSRLNERDAAATQAWLQTNAAFYCIRDHPSHSGYSVSGGLWGGRTKLLKNILRHSWLDIMLSDKTYGKGGYFVDMEFLQNRIWKKVEQFTYCSDSVSCDIWKNAHPFPIRRRGYEHVGQVFDENENARPIDIRIMRRIGENKNCLLSDRFI